ncbi:hypothetical protein [Paenibacillus riograndensis]|uniref:Uncharacterized protein n=1 Tax=Paenibacillus riograndensis SBR5 TaxID=1073571 RepID=A0A0E4H7M5_9BACL|nr:hypothetical protein [Paenibacillus riograndensis]CQR52433.1 hypothetical protein PRIO_0825 [Paenibacillus riograndensis SBR5]
MNLKEVSDWMKNYNFKELLLWIQAAAVHPNNQLYQLRFEYLVACLLSVRQTDFLQKPLEYKDFKKFLDNFFRKTNIEYSSAEDFTPFSQLELIPYFYNGTKYYFFYGSLERPREFIEKFDWMYLKTDIDSTLQDHLAEVFEASLGFQTNILNQIVSNPESSVITKSYYIPSVEYLNYIGQYFQTNVHDFKSMSIGEFESNITIIDKANAATLFKKILIKTADDEAFYVLPQLHTEVLFTIADNLLYSESNQKINLIDATNALALQLRYACEGFFNRHYVLDNIVDISNTNLLKQNEVVVRVADNQLVYFHLLRVRNNSVFSMDTAISIVNNRIQQINFNDLMGLKHYFYDEPQLVPPEALEITSVIVFEHTGINCPPFGVPPTNISYFSFLDLKRLFEQLDSGEEFIRYVKESKFIGAVSRVVTIDALDKFAYFLENGKKFFESGKIAGVISFPTHGWHDYYMNYLSKKYKDNVFEITEQLHPYYYDMVLKQGESVYEICNKRTLNGGILLTPSDTVILLKYPLHLFQISNAEAVKIGEKLLKPMLSEYFVKLHSSYVLLFQEYDLQLHEVINVHLCPVEEILEGGKLSFLSEHLDEIYDEHPFVITTRWNSKKHEKFVFFIYDTSKLHHIFTSEENHAERLFIFELTRSFLHFYCNHFSKEQIKKIAQNFVDANVPISKRRYGMGTSQPRNPRLSEYHGFEKYNQTDISVVNRNVATYLLSIGIEQGRYEGDEARKLNSEIFRFLQNTLEQEIGKFNFDLLQYAYTQLEFIEGHRETINLQRAIDSLTDTDFDVVEKNVVEKRDLSRHSVAVKHIIASILKTGLKNGTGNAITKFQWKQLLAVAIILNETTMLYELDEQNLIPYSITVTDMFEVTDNVGSYVFDSEGFQYEESRVGIKASRKRLQENNNKITDVELNSGKSRIPAELDSLFKSNYGFTFYEMVNILASLGMIDLDRNINFPINTVTIEKLISEVSLILPEFDRGSIEKVIDFLSLSFSSYLKSEELIASQLMRRKERLNLCPLIQIGEQTVLYGNQMCLTASSLWVNSVLEGDYPYSTDCPENIINEVKKIHKRQDDELEIEIENIAIEVVGDKCVIARLDNFKRISKTLPKNPPCGEVDLIVIIEKNKNILVADAKNINKRIRPYDVSLELKRFFNGDKSYANKLRKKQVFVEKHIDLFLEYSGISDRSGWSTTAAFIVNHVYSSAFFDPEITFILVDEFEEYLQQ